MANGDDITTCSIRTPDSDCAFSDGGWARCPSVLTSATAAPVVEIVQALAQPACLFAPCGALLLRNQHAAPVRAAAPSATLQRLPIRIGDRSFVLQLGDPLFVDPEAASLAPWAERHGLRRSHARVAALLLRGHCDKEIAALLGLRPNSVRTYVQALLRDVGAHSRGELVRMLLAFRLT